MLFQSFMDFLSLQNIKYVLKNTGVQATLDYIDTERGNN